MLEDIITLDRKNLGKGIMEKENLEKDYLKKEYSTDDHDNEDAIDRFIKGPKQWANIIIVLLNILIYILVEVTGSSLDVPHMINWGASQPSLIQSGEYHRLFSCMFLHFGLDHLLGNMVLLLFIGDYLEKELGKVKYLFVYIGGGLCATLVSLIQEIVVGDDVVSAGASGAIFAVIGAMIYILIRNKGQLANLSISRLFMMAALSIYVGFSSPGIDNYAHVGGIVAGFILCILVYRKKIGSRMVNMQP